MTARTILRRGAILVAIVSLAGCAGFKTPHFFGLGGGDKTKQRATEGQRIPVLGDIEPLAPSPALKGVDFSLPAPAPQADWPVPGGTPQQSVENVQAAPGFRIAWRHSIGVGSDRRDHIMASPIFAEGHLFTLDGRADVTCLDESGREIWRDSFSPRKGRDQEAFGGGIAYADGTVFLSSGYRFVAAIDARTGNVKWRVDTANPIHTAPNVADGRVFVTDVSDQLFAFDTKTGQSDWTYQALEEPARMLEASSPAISGQVVVAPFASGELIGLATTNGNQLWQDVLSLTNRNNALSEIRDIAGRPVIYRGDVFAGSHSGVFASIDLNTGQRVWSLPINTITTPWPAGDVVYITDQAGELICVARDSGQVYWIRNLNATIPGNAKRAAKKKFKAVWSGPMLASNRVLVLNDRGEALALDSKTGAVQTSLKLGAPAFQSPIAVNGTVYVLTNTGDLIAIR